MRFTSLAVVLLLLGFVSSCQMQHLEPNEACALPVSEMLSETENKILPPAEKTAVIDIRCTASQDAAFPGTEEMFWKDDTFLYGFGSPISEYIIVEYSDGSTQNVKEALADGKIRISELDAYGISYFTEPRLIEDIIYHSDRGGAAEALEIFYEDSGYTYSFPSIRSDVVIVYYTDGTEMPIRQALADGSVRIRDLDLFGIKYYKDKKETRPSGYGSETAAFDSIREMIRQIENRELNWADQKLYDTHGCDIAELRELVGIDEGFSEYLVEWCGGLNCSINYQKDERNIAFMPFYTKEAFEQSLLGMDTYESLSENELILNLVKTDLETEEGIMYACTYDTSKVKGLRMTYHDTIGEDGIRRIVTNQYNTNGEHSSGSIYVFDKEVPFYCIVSGFEADMDFAKRLGTKYITAGDNLTENDDRIGTVIYSAEEPSNQFPTDMLSNENILVMKQYRWDGRGIDTKTIRGSSAMLLTDMLRKCQTSGETGTELSDALELDGTELETPYEKGTMWIEAEGVIYRLAPGFKSVALVDRYLGAGEYLIPDEACKNEINQAWRYWPRDSWLGRYENGILPINHVYRADSAVSAVISEIYIDRSQEQNNSIKIEFTAENDISLDVQLYCQASDDCLGIGDHVSLDLKSGETQSAELTFSGFSDNRYFVYIEADNTWIEITIKP